VHFFVGKNSMQRIFLKKGILFMVGSACCIKQFTTGSRNSLKSVRKSQMMPDHVALLRLRKKQLYIIKILNKATVQWVEELIRPDRRITIDSVAIALVCSYGLAHRIKLDRFKLRKVCA
jgi:hypothetical protein